MTTMFRNKKILLLSLSLIAVATIKAQDDVLYQRDSVIGMSGDCTEALFSRSEKIPSPEKILLVSKNKRTWKLPAFISSINPGSGNSVAPPTAVEIPGSQQYGLLDLDKDGKQELLIINNTGGAHCCDELYIFKNIGPNKYQHAVKTFAGDVCVSAYNEISYSFHQQLGYFFTCFACGYSDTSDAAPVELRGIILHYQKGKLVPVPGDQELRSIINDNLGKLGEQPYEKLTGVASQDNGLRKEFAMNLAVYYFSFGKNLVETKKLFTKYYQFPDAQKVWAEFTRQLQNIQKNSDI